MLWAGFLQDTDNRGYLSQGGPLPLPLRPKTLSNVPAREKKTKNDPAQLYFQTLDARNAKSQHSNRVEGNNGK